MAVQTDVCNFLGREVGRNRRALPFARLTALPPPRDSIRPSLAAVATFSRGSLARESRSRGWRPRSNTRQNLSLPSVRISSGDRDLSGGENRGRAAVARGAVVSERRVVVHAQLLPNDSSFVVPLSDLPVPLKYHN